jgi:hypothetical protein
MPPYRTVPGLLQTPDCARAVIRAGRPGDTAQEIDRRVEVRLERQEVLTSTNPPPPKVSVVLNEGVLARRVGSPEVMRARLTAGVRGGWPSSGTVRQSALTRR